MEQEKQQQKIQVPMLQKSVITDLSEEFSIPDYQPEIKRILRVEAQVMPADRYVGSSSAEFSGKVEYTLFYLGEDGELYGCSFEGDYRVLQPMELPGDLSFDEGILCDADIFSESTTGRLLSPRKFLIKTRLHSEIRLYATKILEEEMPTDCESECLEAEVLCGMHLFSAGEPFHLSEEVIPSTQDPIRVVSCQGKVLVADASANEGKVSCRGDVILKLTVAKEGSEQDPEILVRKLPFASDLAVDGLEVGAMASVDGIVTESDLTVEEGRVLCDLQVSLFARALQSRPVTYTRDLFAVGRLSQAGFEECKCPLPLACGVGNMTLSSTLTLKEAGLTREQEVCDLTMLPNIREVSTENGRLIVTGKCRCHAVVRGGEEWSSTEFEIPFRYDGGSCQDLSAQDVLAKAEAVTCHAKKDGDNLIIDGELAISYTISGEESMTRAVALSVGEEVVEPTASLRICYPTASDSLWSLAKRYQKPIAAIASSNDLTLTAPADAPESLREIRFLVV